MNNKPPIGIMPRWLHDERRYKDLLEAIGRYNDANLKPLDEWIEEVLEIQSKYPNGFRNGIDKGSLIR
jgi:hypothetical protein